METEKITNVVAVTSGVVFQIVISAGITVPVETIVAVIAETGILSVGRIEKKPAEYKGEIVLRSMMYLNLTFDHQVLDGVLAGEFLETVASYLKDPYLIMT